MLGSVVALLFGFTAEFSVPLFCRVVLGQNKTTMTLTMMKKANVTSSLSFSFGEKHFSALRLSLVNSGGFKILE